jgi:rod shape-determining protein MreD
MGLLGPRVHAYVDVMLVPVLYYGIVGSQRSAMFVGCAAGLLQDAWFQVGVFGLNGFKKTLLGWMVGGLGTRLDFNNAAARLVLGVGASLTDSTMDLVLRRLLDRQHAVLGLTETVGKALITGLLVVAAFGVALRFKERSEMRGLA